MAEYIEKEPLLRKAKELQGGSFSSPLIVEAIEKAPTANVVLKSEVLKLVGEYYDKCDECRTKITNAVKAELAREIFEEIEEMLNLLKIYNPYDSMLNVVGQNLAELKKKYREDR